METDGTDQQHEIPDDRDVPMLRLEDGKLGSTLSVGIVNCDRS